VPFLFPFQDLLPDKPVRLHLDFFPIMHGIGFGDNQIAAGNAQFDTHIRADDARYRLSLFVYDGIKVVGVFIRDILPDISPDIRRDRKFVFDRKSIRR
jgi:hypothetical protein